MNDLRTVAELEQTLKAGQPETLQPARLSAIRSQGSRRRTSRLVATTGGAAAAVVVATLVASGIAGDGGHAKDAPIADPTHEMTALATRALAEIPGATQVSDSEVLVPLPPGAASDLRDNSKVPSDTVAVGPVDIGTRTYYGVTAYRRQDFPAWLWDGTDAYEKNVLGDDQGYPRGSTDDGVIVEGAPLRLTCIESKIAGDPCYPAMVSGPDGDLRYSWGMGTDDFLKPGKGLELFSTKTYAAGTPATVWIGGTDGTDVASVDLVATDGTTTAATVRAGTFVPGDTMFWGTVHGELAKAVTRDADGNVLEEHVLKPCADPVSCEVR